MPDIEAQRGSRHYKSGANGLAAASWLSGLPHGFAAQRGSKHVVPVAPYRRVGHVGTIYCIPFGCY
jgi:hypothetical protein